MKISELIDAAKTTVLTNDDIAKMRQRLKDAEDRFEKEAEERRFNPEDYDRYYNI